MTTRVIEADYLIVGSGAMGMAFADVLVAHSDATIVMVDRHHRPGGHWNDAYPFVRLHQPSARYGVNSRELSNGTKDAAGLNRGLDELASGAQVLSYFDQVMQQQLLASGRVQYFPMCNYTGNREFESRITGERYRVTVRKKIVDTAFIKLAVPSTHPPQYAVAPDVHCAPLNDLPKVSHPHSGYVVVGSGKTGIDACLWLLENGVDPDRIRWIMPRDAWFLDRAGFQTDRASLGITLKGLGDQMEAVIAADSLDDLFLRLEAAGQLLRIDPNIMPTMYRCATVTQAELGQLRRIKQIVRLGRVQRIDADQVILQDGEMPADPQWLYVNCSAKAFQQREPVPVFAGDTITPQAVRTCQPVFSAAATAYVEVIGQDDAEKNRLCGVVPLPEKPGDWLRMLVATMGNQLRWSQNNSMRQWLLNSRLDGMSAAMQSVTEADAAGFALLKRYRGLLAPASAKCQQLLARSGLA